MFDELLRGPPGKNGKNGKDGRDGRNGRDGRDVCSVTEMEYARIHTISQALTHDVKHTLPITSNEYFRITGNIITFVKSGDYNIHYHVLGSNIAYSSDKVTVQMIRNNDGFVLDDGIGERVQNQKYEKIHFSKDEAIYFKLVYTPTTLDPIVGTLNIDIKKV